MRLDKKIIKMIILFIWIDISSIPWERQVCAMFKGKSTSFSLLEHIECRSDNKRFYLDNFDNMSI